MLLTQTLLVATLTAAQPTPDQVMSVLNHFYSGQGKGAVLADVTLCKTVEKKDPDKKNDCIEAYGETASKGDAVQVYLTALIPKGDEVEYMVQAVHEGVVRRTKDVKLEGKWIRTRRWRTFPLTKKGTWEFRVLEDGKVVKTLSIEAS